MCDVQVGYALASGYDGGVNSAYHFFTDGSAVRKVYDVSGHLPYCLSLQDPLSLERVLADSPNFCGSEQVRMKHPFTHQEVNVTRLFATNPRGVRTESPSGDFAHLLDGKIYESHKRYEERAANDSGIQMGVLHDLALRRPVIEPVGRKFDDPDTQTLFELLMQPVPGAIGKALDIEVETATPDRFPDWRRPDDRIIEVGILPIGGPATLIYLDTGNEFGKLNPELAALVDSGQVRIVRVDDERELISRCCRITNRTICFTYNGDRFDLRYLMARAERLEVRVPIVREGGRDPLYQRFRPSDGLHLDLFKFFANESIRGYAFRNSYPDLSLDTVSRTLLGRGKVDIGEDRKLDEIPVADLLWYNYNDIVLTRDLVLNDGELVWNIILALSRISNLGIDKIVNHRVSKWIMSYIHLWMNRKGYFLPNKSETKAAGSILSTASSKGKGFEGAAVFPMKPGLWWNAVVLDYSSLYPTIIVRRNLSFETMNCGHQECQENLVPGLAHHVCTRVVGLFPQFLRMIRDVRVEHFKEEKGNMALDQVTRNRYATLELVLKVLINAWYGTTGSDRFDLYCPPIAESTTAYGRVAVVGTRDRATEMDITVIGGDTDSVILHGPTDDDVKKLCGYAKVEFDMDLEKDKVYRFICISHRKKNYLGVLEDGRVDVKGLVGKKRNVPPFARGAFAEATGKLSAVHTPEEFEGARRDVEAIIDRTLTHARRGDLPIEDYQFAVTLQKRFKEYGRKVQDDGTVKEVTPPQFVSTILDHDPNNERDWGPGDTSRFVKTVDRKGKSGAMSLVKAKELVGKLRGGDRSVFFRLDAKKYEEQVRTVFEQISGPLGINIGDLARRRSGLLAFSSSRSR